MNNKDTHYKNVSILPPVQLHQQNLDSVLSRGKSDHLPLALKNRFDSNQIVRMYNVCIISLIFSA